MLARAFVLVDEMVFREAKRDEQSKEARALLARPRLPSALCSCGCEALYDWLLTCATLSSRPLPAAVVPQVYRILSSIHKGFGDLTRKVEETGKLARSARDQERKVEEFAKQPLDLQRILADTEAVVRENGQLEAQLRGLAMG